MTQITLFPHKHAENVEEICRLNNSVYRKKVLETYINACIINKEDLLIFSTMPEINGHVKFGKKEHPTDVIGSIENIILMG
jgi:hypothetical protein